VWLSPNVCHPAAALHLNAASGTLTALENCNISRQLDERDQPVTQAAWVYARSP